MGRSKLLLQWNGKPILEHVLDAWQGSRASAVVVVVRPEDSAARELCHRRGVDVVCPSAAPEQMKQSIQYGLQHASAKYQPQADDAWLVAPADLPTLTAELVDQVIDASEGHRSIVLPRFGGRPGHPVLFPWSLSPQVFTLGDDEGVDRIVARQRVRYLDLPATAAVEDIDTPEDYERLSRCDCPAS